MVWTLAASLAFATAAASAESVAPPSASVPPTPPPLPAPIAGIVAPNVSVLSSTFVTAGQPNRESLLRLKSEGYDAVIYLAPGTSADAIADEAQIVRDQGIEFVHVPIPWQAPEAQHLDAAASALTRLQGKKVLLHCQLNMRASAIAFLYRTIYAKEDPKLAWADLQKVWTPKDQWDKFVREQLQVHGIEFVPPP
jgi:protein tyrosine phosphatase (PTP) superfamily phosphohydrolase (DUF442 family)